MLPVPGPSVHRSGGGPFTHGSVVHSLAAVCCPPLHVINMHGPGRPADPTVTAPRQRRRPTVRGIENARRGGRPRPGAVTQPPIEPATKPASGAGSSSTATLHKWEEQKRAARAHDTRGLHRRNHHPQLPTPPGRGPRPSNSPGPGGKRRARSMEREQKEQRGSRPHLATR